MYPQRSLKGYGTLIVKGMAMGAADVVPGVSGGTIALITGIYDELIYSLKQIGPEALKVMWREGFPAAWRYVNANFLVALFFGVLLSIKTLASVILFALENYPIVVWAFFSGLILASIFILAKQNIKKDLFHVALCALGALCVAGISASSPTQLPAHNWLLFLGGFVAICAMILPGISGSLILLLVGLYPVFINAIKNVEIVAIVSFGLGCVSGLLVFSRFLSWLLRRYHSQTLATLIGFLIGSLHATWPWKVTDESANVLTEKASVIHQYNAMPNSFLAETGQNPLLLQVLLAASLGVILVLLVEFFGKKSAIN